MEDKIKKFISLLKNKEPELPGRQEAKAYS
jgi:hypothetical protein